MISGPEFLHLATTVSLGVLTAALLVTIYRIVVGPSLPDRVLGLDMLIAVVIGYIAAIALRTGFMLYLDIAIALGLVGFLSTVAFARFILQRWQIDAAAREDHLEETRK
ncbi:cation:proton antiporter [Pelagibacterium halotolerans]|uniref:Na(+) H(+) antiporter subunit F n=1 Tax=Pelagibacterium halotolerans (strain DSM 22347 / JCM 15775 / CGMCC 1.7692 / B2) TaxID=1082931 RepID=G4RCJ1_PELHB|nr:cation:proton antiporter [Pelagibacterium halotolerans]AEQ50663.1 Na(+) H(+) antiporter subunit F [Pelagibacterium halotolerans B2]QJR19403.1 cation:proton antiporter [Pelagibacterium halotolerans]SDZ92403.1 multicomponent Na+:H+ antiporter subunit F [Pelagibacterium halotolerans]